MSDNQPSIINSQTFCDLSRHGFNPSGWCRSCDHYEDIDLAGPPADRRYVGAKLKCRHCGAGVGITLRQIKTSNSAPAEALERWRRRKSRPLPRMTVQKASAV